MRVDASTATRAVQRLVEAGLARRANDAADARRVCVAPTSKGRALYDDLAGRRRGAMLEILDDLDLDERRRLADSLEHLVAGLDRYVEHKQAMKRAAAS
jgi:DNA-binding MarR family transcriptional regulator